MRCLTVFAIFMWLLVVSWSSNYWLRVSPPVTLIDLVDAEVCLGIPSCGTRWFPRGSRGLILGSTGRRRTILGSTGRGRPLLYPASVFPAVMEWQPQYYQFVYTNFIQVSVWRGKLHLKVFTRWYNFSINDSFILYCVLYRNKFDYIISIWSLFICWKITKNTCFN